MPGEKEPEDGIWKQNDERSVLDACIEDHHEVTLICEDELHIDTIYKGHNQDLRDDPDNISPVIEAIVPAVEVHDDPANYYHQHPGEDNKAGIQEQPDAAQFQI